MTHLTPKNSQQGRSDEERLRSMLIEDTGSADEADELLKVVTRLKRAPMPKPTPAETARLIERLRPALADGQAELFVSRARRRIADWPPLLLLRSQLRVVRTEIWLASLLVMVLGTAVTLMSHDAFTSGDTLPLVFFAPIVTAVGIGFVYGSEVDPALEITLTLPVSPRLILLARLALVFAFDFILGLAASMILAVTQAQISLWPLVMAWLAPMTFLSAVAFLLSVLFVDPVVGGAASLMLWVGFIAIRFINMQGIPALLWLASLPDLTKADTRPWMLLFALVMGAAGLWIAGREERWIKA